MSKYSAAISQFYFKPNGADHELQKLITQFLHNRVMEDGKVTLGELGYLHQNTLMLNQDTQCAELNIYFDARFVYRKVMNPSVGAEELVLIKEMDIFRNYLFVGPASDVIHTEKVLAPKTEIVPDEFNRATLKIKKGNKQVETMAAVMRCSAPLAIAAALDVSLGDPNFKVKVEPVAKGSNSAVDSIVIAASNRLVPVGLRVQYTARTEITPENCYDPEFAVPYLLQIAEAVQGAERNRVDVARKVKKTGKKATKKKETKIHGGFSKFA